MIRKVVISTGEVTTFAGSGSGSSLDGYGISASFNQPYGLHIEGSALYVAEYLGHKIRKINLSKTETTAVALHNLDDDFPNTPKIVVSGLLSNSGALSVQNSELKLSGGASFTAGSLNVTGSTVVLSDNFTKTGGTVTANTATLELGKMQTLPAIMN